MKLLKSKKIVIPILILFVLFLRHWYSEKMAFYKVNYPKYDISKTLQKDNLTEDDYNLIFKHTGISPQTARRLVEKNNTQIIKDINEVYFKEPEIKKNYIAYPVTASETNESFSVNFADIKKGDILVTFNTHTLDWRHGHCAIVLDESQGILLEHMAVGEKSCITHINGWGHYPGFVVLRYPDNLVASKAADYAKENLVGIDYNIFTGLFKKDKSQDTEPISSQCAHIVWQAYKAVGTDIDSNGGRIVLPRDIAMSDKLEVVQIFGINPKGYADRVLK